MNEPNKERPLDRWIRGHRDKFELRRFESLPYSDEDTVPPEFRKYTIKHLLPHLPSLQRGYKKTQKQDIAITVLHQLVNAGKVGKTVADSRDHSGQHGLRIIIWDDVVAAGLAEICRGSEETKVVTRYMATAKLLNQFESWPLTALVNTEPGPFVSLTNESLIQVLEKRSDGKKRVVPIPPEDLGPTFCDIPTVEYLQILETQIDRINRHNLTHSWLAPKVVPGISGPREVVFQPNVCLRLKYSGRVLLHGRLYTYGAASAQGLSKRPERRERQRMLIDGEPVAELDYKSLHITMLYHLCGLEVTGDAYKPDAVFPNVNPTPKQSAVIRKFVKLATNVCLNVKCKRTAIRATKNLLVNFNGESPLSTKARRYLSGLLRHLDIGPEGVVDRITAVHQPVAHRFFQSVGSFLQTFDGMLMIQILNDLAASGIPALGLHDAVLCKASDAAAVAAMMVINYDGKFGFRPVVERVF